MTATKVRQFTKRSAIARAEGRDIGHPADVLVDLDKHKVALVVFAWGKIPELSVVCAPKDIESFGNVAISVKSIESLHLAIHDKQSLENLQEGLTIRGRPVYSKDGVLLGRISAVLIDENGAVVEYRSRYPWYKGGWFRGETTYLPAELESLGVDAVVTKKTDADRD